MLRISRDEDRHARFARVPIVKVGEGTILRLMNAAARPSRA
jgi:hypothetical protein